MLVLLILITFFFFKYPLLLSGENWCWSLLHSPCLWSEIWQVSTACFPQNHPDTANELKRHIPSGGWNVYLKVDNIFFGALPLPSPPSLDPAETCALTCIFSGTKVCFVCFCSEVPVSELSLELLLLQVVLPALLEQGHTRQWLKNVMHGWAVTAAYLL